MFENVLADLRHYSRFCCGGRPLWRVLARILYAHPASVGVIWYRLGSFGWRLRVPVGRQILQAVYVIGLPVVRMYSGVQILPRTRIGPGLAILHFGGVVITEDCEIGENCLLYHNVSIVTMKNRRGARIGSDFYAGTGTIVIGSVTIEDHVTAGAGCVVTRSIPRNSVVAGVPARLLRVHGPGERPTENQTGSSREPEWLVWPRDKNELSASSDRRAVPRRSSDGTVNPTGVSRTRAGRGPVDSA